MNPLLNIFGQDGSCWHIYFDRTQSDTSKVYEYYETEVKDVFRNAASHANASFVLTYLSPNIMRHANELYPSKNPIERRWRTSAKSGKLSWVTVLKCAIQQKAKNVAVFLDSKGIFPSDVMYNELAMMADKHVFENLVVIVLNDLPPEYVSGLGYALQWFCHSKENVKVFIDNDFIGRRSASPRKKSKSACLPKTDAATPVISDKSDLEISNSRNLPASCYVMVYVIYGNGNDEKHSVCNEVLPDELPSAIREFKRMCRSGRPDKSLLINVISNEIILVYETVEHFSSGKVI